jgi:hypothetical protein
MTLAQGEYYATIATSWANLITSLGTLDPAADDDQALPLSKQHLRPM